MLQPMPHGSVIKRGTARHFILNYKVRKALADARETLAYADYVIVKTRQRLQRTDETLQHMRARGEHEAEHPRHFSRLRRFFSPASKSLH